MISPHIVEDEAYSIRELLHSLDLLPRERIKVSLLLDPSSAFMRKLMERAVAPETYESLQLKYAGDPATGNPRSSIDKVPLDLVTGAPEDFSPIFRLSYEHQTR